MLRCECCRQGYASDLARACAYARQFPSLDFTDNLETEVEVPFHFEDLAVEFGDFDLDDDDDREIIDLCYRLHLMRVATEFDRGRLDDLVRACEAALELADLTGPCLVEALLLKDRFSGYSNDELMIFTTTAIGAAIVPDDFFAAR
jgi:hypothetical protein